VTPEPTTLSNQAALRAAAELHRPLARAAAVARNNALGYVAFGALTLLLSAPRLDLPGIAIGAVLTGVGVAQLRTAPRLRRADPAAPGMLARNEAVLLVAIVIYCVLQLTVLRTSSAALGDQLADAGDVGVELDALLDSVNAAVYCIFLGVALVYQGGLALYFKRRRPALERYLAETPDWARATIEALRE